MNEEKPHHKQQELCKTRPAYRQGRNLTAVKVYTVNNESQHLFIYGVPKINLRHELKSQCIKYGQVLSLHVVSDHETEIFTECYHVRYERIQSARIAKRFLDNKSFYGSVLHVCYVPEYEDVGETRTKLNQRNKDVLSRINGNAVETETKTVRSVLKNRKRKHPALDLTDERMSNLNPNKVWENVPSELDPRLGNVNFPKQSDPVKRYQLPVPKYGPDLTEFLRAGKPRDFKGSQDNCNSIQAQGPLEETVNKKITLIPTQVVKNNCVKRIVFTNKNK